MPKSASALTELSLIRAIRRSSFRSNPLIPMGIGDDCAILTPPRGHDLLVTTDFSLEDRHFRRDTHPPASVGHRCIARGISDIAAMGGRPFAAFLSLALPASLPSSPSGKAWISQFFKGLHALADKHKITLAGGDTAQSPSGLILADITLIGSVASGKALRRSTARAGDILYVTGHIGGSAAELNSLLKSPHKPLIKKGVTNGPHLFPEPRVTVGATLLRRHLATSCIDLSDGLSSDLAHLCQESELAATLIESALPLHPLTSALAAREALQMALHGGEDYELLFSAPPSIRIPNRISGIPITRIGHLLPPRRGRPTVSILLANGTENSLKPKGWEHFASSSSTPAS